MVELFNTVWDKLVSPIWSLIVSYWSGDAKLMTYFGRSKLRLLNFVLVLTLMVFSVLLFLEVQDMADEIERLRTALATYE